MADDQVGGTYMRMGKKGRVFVPEGSNPQAVLAAGGDPAKPVSKAKPKATRKRKG